MPEAAEAALTRPYDLAPDDPGNVLACVSIPIFRKTEIALLYARRTIELLRSEDGARQLLPEIPGEG